MRWLPRRAKLNRGTKLPEGGLLGIVVGQDPRFNADSKPSFAQHLSADLETWMRRFSLTGDPHVDAPISKGWEQRYDSGSNDAIPAVLWRIEFIRGRGGGRSD